MDTASQDGRCPECLKRNNTQRHPREPGSRRWRCRCRNAEVRGPLKAQAQAGLTGAFLGNRIRAGEPKVDRDGRGRPVPRDRPSSVFVSLLLPGPFMPAVERAGRAQSRDTGKRIPTGLEE